MRFFLVNTDYDSFLESLYEEHLGLADAPYREQLQALDDSQRRYEARRTMLHPRTHRPIFMSLQPAPTTPQPRLPQPDRTRTTTPQEAIAA